MWANKALELTAVAWWNVANFHAHRAITGRANSVGGSSDSVLLVKPRVTAFATSWWLPVPCTGRSSAAGWPLADLVRSAPELSRAPAQLPMPYLSDRASAAS